MEFLKKILTEKIGIDNNLIQNLLNVILEKKIKKNEFLIEDGKVCNFLAFVENGVFRSFIVTENAEFNNDFYLPNSIATALTSFLTNEKTNCNIQAMNDSTVYILHKDQLEKLIDSDKQWIKLAKYISDNYFIRKCKRETSFLKDDASERLRKTLELYPNIEQLVPQYQIASYLGIKAQSLSRIKSSHR